MRKGKVPVSDPYLGLMDPDADWRSTKTSGSGSGSRILFRRYVFDLLPTYFKYVFPAKIRLFVTRIWPESWSASTRCVLAPWIRIRICIEIKSSSFWPIWIGTRKKKNGTGNMHCCRSVKMESRIRVRIRIGTKTMPIHITSFLFRHMAD